MNLIQKYHESPQNYILEGDGGFGKSTVLKYMAKRLHGEKLQAQGKTVLVTYISLAEFNVKNVVPGLLFDYLKVYFNNEVTDKAILDMIRESSDTIQYLFLLDGLNELYDYKINEQRVSGLLFNDINKLLECENVNVIITTRRRELIPDFIRNKFIYQKIRKLSDKNISSYLGLERLNSIPGHLREMLTNPMLLRIFKSIYVRYTDMACEIENKFTLFEHFFELDINIHSSKSYEDNLESVRKYVIKNIIPYIAFYVEYCNLSGENGKDNLPDYETLVKEAFNVGGNPNNISFEVISDVVSMLGLVNKKFQFSHDLIRDYFAVKGIELLGRKGNIMLIQNFMNSLIEQLLYVDGENPDLVRRTRFLDLAEFIFALVKDNMYNKLCEFGCRDTAASLCLSENFYQELAGVYDDLKNRENSVFIGRIALNYMESAEIYFTRLESAKKYNFIYYTINYDAEDKESINILMHAKDILDNINEDDLKDDELIRCRNLKGKILSNIGSYYYSLGLRAKNNKEEELKKNYFIEAQKWHKEALDYRKKYCSRRYWAESYRTLMSDAFHMNDFENAYGFYLDAVSSFNYNKSLDEMFVLNTEEAIPEELVERALGSEIKLLKAGKDQDICNKIMTDIVEQIRYVYNRSVELSRINYDLIGSLKGKIVELMDWAGKDNHRDLYDELNKYYMKCENYC